MAARALSERPYNIVSVVGTRPEAIKMAPVVRALAALTSIEQRVLLTGQHRNLAESFDGVAIDTLSLDFREQSVDAIRERLTRAIYRYLLPAPPDLVIVQGDTNSALAGALAAKSRGVPIAHVEAGLRSHHAEPWPEEENRVAIDAIADLLFAPTEAAAANLAAEAAVTGVIHVTGNSGIDALLQARGTIATPMAASPRKTILVTCHRRENQGELARICATLIRLAAEFPVRILFPLHPNRHIRTAVQAVLGGQENIELLEPVDHPEMVRLIDQCWVLLTDSGGLQEEGTTLGRPVLVMRNVTERIEAGPNVELVGIEPNAILAAVHRLLMDEVHYARMAHAALPFGDGRAGPRIASAIEDWLAKRTLRIAV